MEPKRAPVVCIVDDDESVRRALSRLLGSVGLRAQAFASPDEFLARTVEERIACLLLDVQLPGMDGFELRERAVQAGVEAPVIFITSHGDPKTRARAAETDAIAFLEKPCNERVLLDALETALERIADGDDVP
jgi:FixJ family two-component response regulator